MAKKPKIRFNGFQEDWKEEKLGECFKERQDRSAEGELISVTINSGVVRAADTGRRDSSSADKSHYKVVKKGDFAYNSMRMWQGACGDSQYDGILSPAYTVAIPLGKIDTSFFTYLSKTANQLRTYRINSQGMTSDTWNLKFPTFAKIGVMVPDVDEQKQISQFLASVDETISLRERELEKLKQLKAACLDKMFANGGGKSRPSIRFAGFTDEWQSITLGEITNRVTRKNSNLECQLPLTISATYGLISQADFYNARIASADLSGYYLLYNGEFAYNKSTSSDYPWGAIKRLDNYDKGVISTLYIAFVPKEDVDSNFIVSYYETDKWYDEIKMRAAEGARNHGLLNIAPVDFFDTEILIPIQKKEQEKVGQFCENIGKIILLRQKELTKLRNLKQACLAQMFAAA